MELVLVHLGGKIPRYAKRNLTLLHAMFPHIQRTMMVDSEKNGKIALQRNFNIETITMSSVSISEVGRHHDLEFRNGFWFTSFFRLISVCEYAIKVNKPIIHIENDVLLAPNFPFDQLTKGTKAMWFQFNEQRDVAAILFLPNKSVATWLKAELIRKYAEKPSHTDMTVLREIARENQEMVEYFPVAESPESKIFRSDISTFARTQNSQGFEKFEGIFDSAPIGMYFLGRDPRNHRGQLVRFMPLPESFVGAEASILNFDHERMSLKIDGDDVKIFNLHVHSKLPKIFEPRGLNHFFVERTALSNGINKKLLIPVYIQLILSFTRRHKIHSFAKILDGVKNSMREK